ncbi:hypothetical protein M0802_014105 [Mischocyttarus mexicanus]|nr:hypothetical protein M0802_014105 [Mischocyttarus mexicanus]
MSKNFDGPRAYTIIGNAFVFLGDLNVITKRLIKLSQKHKFPSRLWVGSELYVILEDPMQFKIIAKSSHGLEKSKFYDVIKPCVGNGLLTASDSFLALDLDLQSKPECKLHKNLQE